MLDWLDHVASIATALIAALAYGQYVYRRRKRRIALEEYLARQRKSRSGEDSGQRTVLHLMANLRMTEAEIFEAAFSSDKIVARRTVNPETRLSDRLLFMYEGAEHQ